MVRMEKSLVFLLLAPALGMLLVFTVLPALWAAYISFTDLALIGPKALNYQLVGLKNYIRLFTNRDFYHSLWLSLEYTALTNIGQFILGLAAALILGNRRIAGRGVLLAVIVLPMVIPGVTQSLIWSSMFGAEQFGTLNRVLGLLGFDPVTMFDLVFTLTRGGPGNATELVGIYVYNQGFKYFELGYGSAAALIMLLISLVAAPVLSR